MRETNAESGRRRIRNPRIRFVVRQRRQGVGSGSKFQDPDPSRGRECGNVGRVAAEGVSARKLGAEMWHCQLPDVSEPGVDHLQKHGFNPEKDIFHKLKSSVVLPNPSMEKATKWDSKCSKPSDQLCQSFVHLKLFADQQITETSSLEAELDKARARITELECKQQSSKKKLEHFLKKVAEEKDLWLAKEHKKICSVIDGMKNDLNIERKNRRRTEILNSKLVDELTEVKRLARRYFQDCEKEKKGREMAEEVCDELAKEVSEDRTEAETLKRELVEAREELEEERRMLQMAEVLREERVQMKLVDAKLALEEQFSQLKMLRTELESFLRSRGQSNPDAEEIKEAEVMVEAVAESLKFQEIEFTYKPPPAYEDILSIFEELQPREETKKCDNHSPTSNASKINTASPATDIFLDRPTNGSGDDDSEWETLSHGDGTDRSISEFSKGSRKKASPISSLWRPSRKNDCEGYKKSLGEIDFSPVSLEHWSSPESVNSQKNRATKGCIDWQRLIQKQSLKAKLLEARLESRTVQIRHVLEQKI